MATPSQSYFSFLIVDIENFGKRNNGDQQWLREQLHAVLTGAARQSGVPWDDCEKLDRGDAVILMIPASIPKNTIADGLIRELRTALAVHKRRSHESVAMRLRASLHAGDAIRDDRGWAGAELNTACRLVDIEPLRTALSDSPSSLLALAVSDHWYQTVVRHDPGEVDHRNFRSVPIRVKELDTTAWIHVPGAHHTNPRATADKPAPADPQGAGSNNVVFHAPVAAQTVIARDQVIHGSTPRGQEPS